MKKLFCFTVAILFLVNSVTSFASAKNGTNWYFISKSENDRPHLPELKTDSAKGIGKDEKVLFLTFDAGYENGNVEKIVDILKENEVSGAFFILKHLAEANPELCKKMKENGNLVCNHTATHPSIVTLSPEKLTEEVQLLEKVYREQTGYELDRYFRPPEGAWSEESLKTVADLGYRTVFWSLAWADWDNTKQEEPEKALARLLARVHDGAVILLHPTSETNTKILARFIQEMKKLGYRFGSLEELWQ